MVKFEQHNKKNLLERAVDQRNVCKLFVDSIIAQKRLAFNTKLAYEKDLDCFTEFYNLFLADNLSNNLLQSFYVFLKDKQLSQATIARRISTVIQFMKYCVSEKVDAFDCAKFGIEDKPNIKPKQTYVPFMESEDLNKLRNVLSDSMLSGSKSDLRIATIIEMLYSTGMRISELLALKIECTDEILKNRILLINGKGGHERYVFFNSIAIELLAKYMQVFKLHKNDFLFKGSLSKPLTRQRVFQLLKNIAKKAGVDLAIVSPHSFRHRMLTDLVEGKADLVSVQKIAGHKQINTTARYIHIDDRLYDDIVEKHPLNYMDKIIELD